MGGLFSNSFSSCIGQQIQWNTSWSESRKHKFSGFRQQHISLRRIQLSRAALMDTSWLKSRLCKFTDIGNSIFLQERSSIAAEFSEGFTPYSLFSLNCREQQGLKISTSCENSEDYSIHIFSAPWLEPKRVIFSAGCVSFKKSLYFLPAVATIKVSSNYYKIIPTFSHYTRSEVEEIVASNISSKHNTSWPNQFRFVNILLVPGWKHNFQLTIFGEKNEKDSIAE